MINSTTGQTISFPNIPDSVAKPYSIALRLTLSLALTVAVISLFAATTIYIHTHNTMEKKLEEEADEMLNFLVGALTIPLWDLNEQTVESIGNTLFQNKLVSSIVIKKRSGKILYSSTRKKIGEINIQRKEQISHQSEHLGEIEIELTRKSIADSLYELSWSLGTMTAFGFISLLLFTGLFIRRYLKLPLDILNLNIQDYVAGRYNSWKALPYAEFQKVEQVLVEMGSTIQQQMDTIQQQMDSLKQSEEKYRVLFESFPLGITITDHEGSILEINQMAEQLLEVPNTEHKKRSIDGKEWTIIRTDGTPMPVDEYASVKALKENRIVKNVEMGFVKTYGNVIWLNVTAAPIPLKKYGLAITYSDITEKQHIEKQLQQAQKMEAIGILAGGIAHDFNNILVPIIGYTEMLSEEIPKESPLRPSLDEIYAASMRAKDMVRQILTFSRQEHGEVKLMKMHHIVKEALKLIRSTIPATIDIKNYVSKDCGAINADPTQIHQIVMNLATNAYHAMEETGGIMTISLKEVELNEQDIIGQDIQKGIYACLTVSDTGIGIPDDIKEKIFDPFFTTKKQGKGTGLGLSSVHGIVTSSGGAIRLNSEIGKGTEFNIYLPVAESYFKKDDVLQATIPTQGGNERILLVDDEAVLITLQKAMLERLGYQVTSRSSSIEALEAFRANPDKFDIVITDMAMPNMSGDKLAVELIKIRPDIPVLLCTGFSTIMSEEKALSMGIKGFLMKPVAIRDIDKKIRGVLDSNK